MPRSIGPHLLGRRPSPPDDRDYKMAAALPDTGGFFTRLFYWLKKLLGLIWSPNDPVVDPDPPAPEPVPGEEPDLTQMISWLAGDVLNQADTPHCVGFAGAGFEGADPVQFPATNEEGHRLYYLCKEEDGEPHEENGTWVRSLAKSLQKEARIGPYYFADDSDGSKALEEVRLWLRVHGPVVFGTDWFDDMFRPNYQGYVFPTGDYAGGHGYLCIGDDPMTETLLFQNSWDLDWGDGGFFRMLYDDVRYLLGREGEAMGTTEYPR